MDSVSQQLQLHLQPQQEQTARGQSQTLLESTHEDVTCETGAAAASNAVGSGGSVSAAAKDGGRAFAGALGGVGFGVSVPPLVQCASFEVPSSAGSQTSLNALVSAEGSVANLLAAAATTAGTLWSAATAPAPSPGLSAEKRTLSDLNGGAAAGKSPERGGSKMMGVGRVALGVEKWWKSTEGTSSTTASSSSPPLALAELPEAHSRRETIGDIPEKLLVYNDPELDIESEMPSADRVIPEAIWKRFDKKEKERQKVLHGT